MAASKSPSDWVEQMVGMFAFRAFAGGKAIWMLNYSWDGERGVSIPESMKTLFAAQLTAGANTWHAKGHVMSGSNDMAMRTEAFAWIARHEETFYDAREPIDAIGVYFSPQTRNYFAKEYTKSFKSVMNLMMQSHLEFQIVTPRTLARFRGRLLILPDARCIGDEEIAAAGSARLLITGDTRSLQADGVKRPENPFHDKPRAEPGFPRSRKYSPEPAMVTQSRSARRRWSSCRSRVCTANHVWDVDGVREARPIVNLPVAAGCWLESRLRARVKPVRGRQGLVRSG